VKERSERERDADATARAIEVRASKARMNVDGYKRELADEPFWHFLRRRAIGRALADARREQRALSHLRRQADPP
jgi:hypothetical protein